MEKYILQRLFSIIDEYTSKGKILDEAAIRRIALFVPRKLNLEEYVTAIYPGSDLDSRRGKETSNNSTVMGQYNKFTGDLYLYLTTINNYISEYDVFDLTDKERIYLTNLEIMDTFLHELMHAQQRSSFDNKTSYFEDLLYLSLDVGLLEKKYNKSYYGLSIGRFKTSKIIKARKSLHRETYAINPCERIANIRSYEVLANYLNDAMKDPKNPYRRVASIMYYKYLRGLIRGYDEYQDLYTCPTEDYLYSINAEKIWKKFDFYNPDREVLKETVIRDYNQLDRFEYGLPVTDKELSRVNSKIDEVQCFIDKTR